MLRRLARAVLPGLLLAAGCQEPPAREAPAPPRDAGGGRSDAGGPPSDAGDSPSLTPLFVTGARPACALSAPIAITSQGEDEILIATADGVLSALDPMTGSEVWRAAPTPAAGLLAHLAAPPVVVGHRLVFAWQEVKPDWTRVAHHVDVLDLDARGLDLTFPRLTLAGSRPAADGAAAIDFLPAHAYSRAALVHADVPDRALGLVYVSFGNVRDLQPWHGWVFEIDLDAWQTSGAAAAVTGSLATTAASASCGAENDDGAREMVCGGGVWSALGPEIIPDPDSPDGFALLIATGNGLLDPTRASFANSVLRVGRGLAFDAACDPMVCEGFDPTAPTDACAQSCGRLFIPRLPAAELEPRGPNDACVGLTLFQCWAALDYDLGADAPAYAALPGGPNVIVQPGKDGAVYLIDADHLGTLYDRAPIMPGCGEGGGTCLASWAGTIVTKPALAVVGGATVALVPTFVMDDTHPAGLQALQIDTQAGTPRLRPLWQAPAAGDPAALSGFRSAPGSVAVVEAGGQPFATFVDPSTTPAALYWVRVSDGAVIQRLALAHGGERYARPLAAHGVLYVPSCDRTGTPSFDEGPSVLEAFRIGPGIGASLPP